MLSKQGARPKSSAVGRTPGCVLSMSLTRSWSDGGRLAKAVAEVREMVSKFACNARKKKHVLTEVGCHVVMRVGCHVVMRVGCHFVIRVGCHVVMRVGCHVVMRVVCHFVMRVGCHFVTRVVSLCDEGCVSRCDEGCVSHCDEGCVSPCDQGCVSLCDEGSEAHQARLAKLQHKKEKERTGGTHESGGVTRGAQRRAVLPVSWCGKTKCVCVCMFVHERAHLCVHKGVGSAPTRTWYASRLPMQSAIGLPSLWHA
jgi:hypothetical protein